MAQALVKGFYLFGVFPTPLLTSRLESLLTWWFGQEPKLPVDFLLGHIQGSESVAGSRNTNSVFRWLSNMHSQEWRLQLSYAKKGLSSKLRRLHLR